MSQRPDCRDAKHTCRRRYTEEVERTYCGKTSKKDKNTAVIFKEHRTNQILRSNENRWIGSKQDFWSFLEASFMVIMFKKDKNCATSSFPISLKYMDDVRRTNTTLNVLQELSDDGNVHGDRQLSGPCTSFTPPRGDTLSRGRWTRIQATFNAREHVARKLVRNVNERNPGKKKNNIGQMKGQSSTMHGSWEEFFHRSGRQGILKNLGSWAKEVGLHTLQCRAHRERPQGIYP